MCTNLSRFYFLLFISITALLYSCKDTKDDMMVDEPPCQYKFSGSAGDIFGAWEPAEIIDLVTGDTTYYEKGEGHTGFIFKYWYADAFELRENYDLTLYYVVGGRPCEGRVHGTWKPEGDSLRINLIADTLLVPILSLSHNELVIIDEVNFSPSIAKMRRANN